MNVLDLDLGIIRAIPILKGTNIYKPDVSNRDPREVMFPSTLPRRFSVLRVF